MKISRKKYSKLKKSEVGIINALLTLIDTIPYEKITIKMIAEEADFARWSVYHNFSTKEEILKRYIKIILSDLVVELNKTINDFPPKIIPCFVDFWESHSEIIKFLYDNQMASFIENESDEIMNLIMDAPAFVQKNKISEFNKNQRDYYSKFLMSGTIRVLNCWLENNMRESKDDIHDLLRYFIKKQGIEI